jgi:hypothetical protein
VGMGCLENTFLMIKRCLKHAFAQTEVLYLTCYSLPIQGSELVRQREPTAWLAGRERKGYPLFAESKSETCTEPVRFDKRTRGPASLSYNSHLNF